MLAHLAFISVELDYWYTDAGLLQGEEARLAASPLRFSPLHWVQDPVSVRCVVGVVAAVAVAFVLGWRTRIMGILLYVGLLSLYHRNISSNCGPDQLMMITAFYMMLSPCGAAFSLDARRASRRGGQSAEPLIVPWAQRSAPDPALLDLPVFSRVQVPWQHLARGHRDSTSSSSTTRSDSQTSSGWRAIPS